MRKVTIRAAAALVIDAQPMNASRQEFHYVERPSGGPDWAIRFQLQFLFPR
jgi:hypothetical protein